MAAACGRRSAASMSYRSTSWSCCGRRSRVADTCADLQAMLDRDGLLLRDRIHPASVELRQQRLLLGRLIVALRVPLGDTGDEDAPRTQYRGLRGPYAPRGLHAVDGNRA